MYLYIAVLRSTLRYSTGTGTGGSRAVLAKNKSTQKKHACI
jgi:hypothetical protein